MIRPAAAMTRFRILPATIACLSLLMVAKLYEIYEGGNRFSEAMLGRPAFAVGGGDDAQSDADSDEQAQPDGGDAGGTSNAGDEQQLAANQATGGGGAQPEHAMPQGEREYSEFEVNILQSLAERRKALDELEEKIRMKENLLEATEQRLNKKIAQIKELESVVRELLAKYDKEENARIQSLVKIYEKMQPKKAARIFNTMDLPTLMLVVERMSERRAAPVMARMEPEKARELTQELAEDRKLRTKKENELDNLAN